MAFHFLNSKQHFASIHWEPIVSERGYTLLKENVQKNWDSLSPKEQNAWEDVFKNLDALPVKQTGSWREKEASRVVVGIGTFATKSPHNDTFPDEYSNWGWENVANIQTHARTISQYKEKYPIWVNVVENFKKVLKWKQRLEDGEYQLKVFDPIDALAQAESYAIYIPSPSHTGGFLDGRGSGGAPLAGARMFETAGSAHTTINSRGLRNAVVVKVKSNLLGLDTSNTESSDCEDILSAVALMEKKRLEKALEEASVEQLRARLALLEGGLKSTSGSLQNVQNQDIQNNVEEEAPKKRRM